MMRSASLSPTQLALTPGLKFVIRDKAHASRRAISRPWEADPFIKDVAWMMARGRGSISRIVQNSLEVRRVFSGYVQSSTNGTIKAAVTNMRAACHRFESFQKPIGRCCLHLRACIRTALYVAGNLTTDASDRANEWLRWLDSEKCLQLAMMADASDQAMALTRLLDSEGDGSSNPQSRSVPVRHDNFHFVRRSAPLPPRVRLHSHDDQALG